MGLKQFASTVGDAFKKELTPNIKELGSKILDTSLRDVGNAISKQTDNIKDAIKIRKVKASIMNTMDDIEERLSKINTSEKDIDDAKWSEL